MRTKYILGMVLSAAVLFTGCMKEDIDELRAQQAENAERIAALEEWQATVNSNIGTLQQLVTALEGNDYVTGVVPFDTPTPGGYRITFSKSGEATIWNGAQGDTGAAGHAPVIGVAGFPEASGVYYWTLDSEFITDNGTPSGNKMPVTGDTPRVAIGTDGNWYISADGTATGDPSTGTYTGWTNTGVEARGDQGDAIFAADGVNNSYDDYVEFTLADGTTKIQVPKYKEVGISFTQPENFTAATPLTINYIIPADKSAPSNIRVVDIPTGWSVEVNMDKQQFTITPPTVFTQENMGGEGTILIADANRVVGMYPLNLGFTGPFSNTFDAVYYQNGVQVGRVYVINDGTPGSGLILRNDLINSATFQDPGEPYLSIDASAMTGQELFDVIKETWPDTWQRLSPWAYAAALGEGWFVGSMTDWMRCPLQSTHPLVYVASPVEAIHTSNTHLGFALRYTGVKYEDIWMVPWGDPIDPAINFVVFRTF